jgi:hypothetical protein
MYKQIAGAALLDFSAAFDIIDHSLLLEKLMCYNFTPSVDKEGSQVEQWSKALHLSARGIRHPGSNAGCITTGHDWESHRPVYNWPSVVWVWQV